jgi:large subunit ribosomal protein L10
VIVVKEEKLKAVEKLKKEIEDSSVIGIVNLLKLPSRQLQQIKKKIKGQVVLRVVKKSTLQFAIKAANKKNKEELEKNIPQQPALALTNLDPFKFYVMIDKLKSPAAAKEGDITPADIQVSAGPTNLLPGPAISELTKAGIPAGVEEGKIAVKKDVVVAKKGDVVSKNLANALKKLGIEPILIGLNIVAIYQDGTIYKKDALSLVSIYPDMLKDAFNKALNLSVSICYPTKENVKYLLAKAVNTAKALESKFGGVK